MSLVHPDMHARLAPLSREHLPWFIAIGGFAVMYLPVYWIAANGIWQTDDNGHGPIILAVLLYLFWTKWREIVETPARPAPLLGWPLFAAGLLLYVFGRAFSMASVEFFSQLPVIAATLLLIKGRRALRVAWFPVLYLIFMVPLPNSLVDAITGPLKQWISDIVETLLYAAGYPIARTGVILQIGQYQLLVADACSGLHSMFSLTALGTLFMYMMDRKSRLHNAIMLASILPIAFVANIVRVIILVLVTYHLGDEAGQGFLHGTAGVVLMLVALGIFFALDSLLKLVLHEGPRHAART
ncbi:exosortase B [Piscinibacter sp. XHJ-5]|uniref:exosortase B n=1 Tax=Piscinibacter sp. XHJ-5 TaxID=3037797 RepID=UPI0024534526|nr:exosortase B [Piscinibacter sp. XHJ-5]